MVQSLNSLLAPAVMERVTLVLNHVLGAESAATGRLRPHAGRRIEIVPAGWPSLLPPLPSCLFGVTPAGLLEWVPPPAAGAAGAAPAAAADLVLRVDASNPALLMARALAGETPPVDIEGDAALAGDVNWLMQNLRWDVASDLERAVGPGLTPPLLKLGKALAGGVRLAVQGAGQVAERLRPRR